MHTRFRIVLALLLLLSMFGAAACGGDSGEAEDTPANEAVGEEDPAGTEGQEPEDDGDSGQGDDTIVAEGLAFSPTSLTIASGTQIEVDNEDSTEHTFTIDGTAIDEDLAADTDVQVTIDLEAGDYDWFCKIHPSMTGTLTVT
ncbi:MAG: cupredoxin domain-containing protein [Actinomycetota bacterium]